MKKTLTIDGDNVKDIASFYDEINRVLMADEDWKIGASLDALNNALYGGFGAIGSAEHIQLVWLNMKQSRTNLGFETTRNWYRNKLPHPGNFDLKRISKDLAELENGDGPTYFEIVLEIIAAHPNIELVPG